MQNKILLALFLFPLPAVAQTVYTAADYLAVGDSLRFSTAAAGLGDFDFAATGADFTWDFADLPVANQRTDAYFDPNDAGYRLPWCLANGYLLNCQSQFDELTNLGRRGLDTLNLGPIVAQNLVNHSKKTDGAYAETMLGLTAQIGGIPLPLTFEYENRDSVFQFPIAYGNIDSSRSRLNFDLTGLNIPFNQSFNNKRVNTVDGYGSLTTPYGVFENTLRMRTVVERTDTTFLDNNTIPVQRTTVEYKWFDPAHPAPLLQATGTISGGTETITQITYLDSVRCLPPTALFYYLPLQPQYDPGTQSAAVEFFNLSGNADSLYWDFGDNATSSQVNPTHTFLCPGQQQVTLISYNTVCAPLAADTVTLPVFINDTSAPDTSQVVLCAGDSLLINEEWVSEPGFYEAQFTSVNGCDSTAFVDLEVVAAIDPAVTLAENTLTAQQAGAAYQWIDCATGQPLAGATGQSFTPEMSGDYAVVITAGSCADTSECTNVVLSSTRDRQEAPAVRVFPNPAKEVVRLVFEGEAAKRRIVLMDLAGRTINQWSIGTEKRVEIPLSLAPGMYFFRIEDNAGGSRMVKFLKK